MFLPFPEMFKWLIAIALFFILVSVIIFFIFILIKVIKDGLEYLKY